MALPLQVPVGSVQLAETLVYVPVVAAYPDQFVLSAWCRMPPRAFGTAPASRNAMKPRIQCVLTQWNPESSALGRRDAAF